MVGMDTDSRPVVRPAAADDFPAVARLRWWWLRETGERVAGSGEDFVEHFTAWARRNSTSHRCLVLVRDDTVIGMGWLALVQRVPTPLVPERLSGDVQCVYVVPGERDAGLGGQLIDALLELARELGLERVTVHSSFRAISAYCRRGFGTSPRLLQTHLTS